MFVTHPLYRIPAGYPQVHGIIEAQPGVFYDDPDSGDLLVFATVLAPDHRVEEEDLDWVGPLSDFAVTYVPEIEEIKTALRTDTGRELLAEMCGQPRREDPFPDPYPIGGSVGNSGPYGGAL